MLSRDCTRLIVHHLGTADNSHDRTRGKWGVSLVLIKVDLLESYVGWQCNSAHPADFAGARQVAV